MNYYRQYNKYSNKKTEVDNHIFSSKKEANRYCELKLMMRATGADAVDKIELQPEFVLQEGFTDFSGKKHRAIKYISDFKVFYKDGRIEIEDVKSSKSFQTDVYRIKKKLFLFKYQNIIFKEIY